MGMEGNTSARRRVFVQTETGSVLGLELDRADNARTVKRRLQLALNTPFDESSLTYGDTVFRNDLSNVRNDSPLLLTRNSLHKSSSTPCLSPTATDLQLRDRSGPIEILGCSDRFSSSKQAVKDVVDAMKLGIEPIPVSGGLGGGYYFRNCMGESIAIVKPTDEEPFAPNNPKGFVGKALGLSGLKRSMRVGETGFREVAAYLLDHGNFANVPPTMLVKVTHSIFNVNSRMNEKRHVDRQKVSKLASFQHFVPHDFDASDHGTSGFPVASVHRIGILDIRILNTDRHAGNLLVRKLDGVEKFNEVELIPIDHGLCLPEGLEDPYFEWIHWPQASIPFSEEELEYIDHLDPVRDTDMLRMELPMIRDACLRVLFLCTVFLKEAAKFGLCLAEIGEMMSREYRGLKEEPSEFESICIRARRVLEDCKMPYYQAKPRDVEEFKFDTGCKEAIVDQFLEVSETVDGQEGGDAKREVPLKDEDNVVSSISKLSMSVRNISFGEKSWQHQGVVSQGCNLACTSSGNRSVNEQLPASSSFVKLGDMSDDDWVQFLKNFLNLLRPTFGNRKSENVGQRQRQRLGTSCQF